MFPIARKLCWGVGHGTRERAVLFEKRVLTLSGRSELARIVLYMLVLMFTSCNPRCTPHPYTLLLMRLLTRKLCEDGEHAWNHYQKSESFA